MPLRQRIIACTRDTPDELSTQSQSSERPMLPSRPSKAFWLRLPNWAACVPVTASNKVGIVDTLSSPFLRQSGTRASARLVVPRLPDNGDPRSWLAPASLQQAHRPLDVAGTARLELGGVQSGH